MRPKQGAPDQIEGLLSLDRGKAKRLPLPLFGGQGREIDQGEMEVVRLRHDLNGVIALRAESGPKGFVPGDDVPNAFSVWRRAAAPPTSAPERL